MHGFGGELLRRHALTITIDVRTETTGVLDECLQHSVRENVRVLKFTASEFTNE